MSLCITREAKGSDSRISWLPATEKHCRFLAGGLRPGDLAEARHTVGAKKTAFESLNLARKLSQNPMVATVDRVPFAMFGCEARDGFGEPWMLGTTIVDELPKMVFREAKALVKQWVEEHGALCNLVWGKSKSLLWLEHLGFFLTEEMELIVDDEGNTEQYRTFYMEAE